MKEIGLIEGRNPYLYIKGFPELKFASKDFRNACLEKPDLFKRASLVAAPYLYGYLGNADDLASYDEPNEEVLKRLEMSNVE